MKNTLLLEMYRMPETLEGAICVFVDHYSNRRYHESLNRQTPADVSFGRAKDILDRREKTRGDTLATRCFMAQQTRLAAGP
jgi:hypothetical protein